MPPDATWYENDHTGHSVGLFTVSSESVAETILGKITYRRVYPRNLLSMRVVQKDASSYTVEAVFDPRPGFVMSFR